MAAQCAARGKKALDAQDYEAAIYEYTSAIYESPTSPDFYNQRSLANLRAGHAVEALADAEQAVINGESRAKKEAITEAQFRRGLALYKLGRLGDAEFILNLVKQRDEKHKQADMWIQKTKLDLSKLDSEDEKRKCTVKVTPAVKATPATSSTGASTTAPKPAPPTAPQQTPADKIRHEWYQSNDNVYFTLLAKGVPKDKAHIEITDQAVNISFPILGESHKEYNLTLEPLFAAVVPENCTVRVLPSKVEIILIKRQPGQKWPALEGEYEAAKADSVAGTDAHSSEADQAMKRAVFAEPAKGPAYPTSSRSGPKDWDKLASEQLKAGRSGGDSKDGALEDDEEYEGGDPANHFFQKLFKGSSPDVQRAMMKSYTESNGTSLSTNWDEVSKGKVETVPPEGMEAKKY